MSATFTIWLPSFCHEEMFWPLWQKCFPTFGKKSPLGGKPNSKRLCKSVSRILHVSMKAGKMHGFYILTNFLPNGRHFTKIPACFSWFWGLRPNFTKLPKGMWWNFHVNRSCKSRFGSSKFQRGALALKNWAQVVHGGQAMHPTSWYGKYLAWIPYLLNHLSCCKSSSIKIPSFRTAFFCHMFYMLPCFFLRFCSKGNGETE